MDSTKRTCITCTAKGVNSNRVPLWSKKDGLYSMLPKILNCDDKYNPNKHSLKKETPEITGTKLEAELHIKEKNLRKIKGQIVEGGVLKFNFYYLSYYKYGFYKKNLYYLYGKRR